MQPQMAHDTPVQARIVLRLLLLRMQQLAGGERERQQREALWRLRDGDEIVPDGRQAAKSFEGFAGLRPKHKK